MRERSHRPVVNIVVTAAVIVIVVVVVIVVKPIVVKTADVFKFIAIPVSTRRIGLYAKDKKSYGDVRTY